MKERPIIFTAPEVRAILASRKTMTRRVVKPRGQQREWADFSLCPSARIVGDAVQFDHPRGGPYTSARLPCAPGDRLWVRHPADVFPVYYKAIPDWEDRYAAGTDGRIYRIDRAEPESLAGTPSSRGYLTVSLSRGGWTTHAVHRLVCETFYGPPPFDGAQVRHLDGDQKNNRPDNLDWGTPSLPQRTLARQYGVSQSTIGAARKGDTWGEHEAAPRNLPAYRLWKSPIHMPRWASRITLEITDVRVERLQDISEADARAEGISDGGCKSCGEPEPCECDNPLPDARDSFAGLWQSINGDDSWSANPWVWVITFRRENHA